MAAVIWLFVALAITSSYTASLTSFLTNQNSDPPVITVETLIRTGAKVGCNGNSFVVNYLHHVLDFDPQNIVRIYKEDDYPKALRSGQIAAAFLEVPYIKLLLAKIAKALRPESRTKSEVLDLCFLKILQCLPTFLKRFLMCQRVEHYESWRRLCWTQTNVQNLMTKMIIVLDLTASGVSLRSLEEPQL